MKQNDYIVIQAPMITELGLSGNRLIVYALINGFSKDGVHEFHGSINYICEWTNLTRNTVISVLKSLVDDELIEKREYIENKVKFCAYRIRGSAKNALPVQSTTSENDNTTNLGSAKIAPNNNNIVNNTLFGNTIIEKEKISKKEKDETFEKCWIAYHRKGRKKQSKLQWDKLTDDERSKVLQHIIAYTSEREIQYQQDFERYLRDKTFNTVIYGKGNKIIYDPSSENQPQSSKCQNKGTVIIGGQTYK